MRPKLLILILICIIAMAMTVPGLANGESVFMTVGESRIFDYSGITRVATSNPDVLELVVTAAGEVIANAKSAGLSTVHLWYGGKRVSFHVNVAENYSSLAQEIAMIIGIPTVRVRVTAKTVVLEGNVPTDLDLARAEKIAKNYRETVLNFLEIDNSYQVLISALITEIRVDDVNSLGIEWGSMNVKDGKIIGTSMIWEYLFESSTFDTIEQKNPFDQKRTAPIGTRLNYLFQNGNAKLLAAPSILVRSGKQAEFLVGGEIPLPIKTEQGITVEWKSYGIKLAVEPSIERNNLINLKVIPEVSNLDWANAIIVSEMKVPAISTRRAKTELSIQGGSTLALGGLLRREDSKTVNKVPGLGDLPIIGRIFRSTDYRQGLTELVIFVTPTIVPIGQSPTEEQIIPMDQFLPESRTEKRRPKGEN